MDPTLAAASLLIADWCTAAGSMATPSALAGLTLGVGGLLALASTRLPHAPAELSARPSRPPIAAGRGLAACVHDTGERREPARLALSPGTRPRAAAPWHHLALTAADVLAYAHCVATPRTAR
jgi:hypothetical protein